MPLSVRAVAITSFLSNSYVVMERWKILRRAVLRKKYTTGAGNSSSVRGFESFGLFKVHGTSSRWLNYSYVGAESVCEAAVKTLPGGELSLETLVGFNNTGNVCVWPSEEVMAYYCLENKEMFREAHVCELGCGMTGLAGIMLACANVASEVLLTDGNETSIANIEEIVEANKSRYERCTRVIFDILRWESLSLKEDYKGRFDYVVCADCLFFTDVHRELALVINMLLKPSTGVAIVFAPSRGGTLERFCCMAQEYFKVELIERYSEQIWKVCQEKPPYFNVDLHYPLKIVLKQKQN